MPGSAQTVFQPRKTPVQARSTASVDAILEATLQVLLQVGKERLTTTRVAERAGVSIGTLYQYFPNKSALLQATLKRHFDEVIAAVEQACEAHRGATLEAMAIALVSSFLRAKMKDGKSSVALYAVSSDVDGMVLAREVGARMHTVVCTMLSTASDGALHDVDLVTTVLLGAMAGVSRRLLEEDAPERRFAPLLQELTGMASGYLQSCPRRNTARRS